MAPGDDVSIASPLCLVTGATGYIGGRLVPELLAAGCRVRVLARHPDRLRDHPWTGDVEIVQADVSDPATLGPALAGIDVAYYLVHALGTAAFENTDRVNAETFARPRATPGSGGWSTWAGSPPTRVGAGASQPTCARATRSPRSCSRSGVPTVVLRAAVIIGSGSASFEMLRYLTERLPAMITPRWLKTRIQPIAIRDVLRYLVGCARLPAQVHRSFDIGGPDVLTYRDMMVRYAAVAGLPRRLIVPVPVLTPWLSSHWVGLVTPVPSSLARPLVESLRTEVVCREHDIADYVPDPPGGLLGFEQAVELALARIRDADVATRWSSASVPGAPSDPLPTDPDWAGGSLYVDRRTRAVAASPAAVWRVIEGIGGERGWYSFPAAWRVRGIADRLIGGVGLRRGRRHPDRVSVGETHRLLAGGVAGGERHAAAARRDAAAGTCLAGARRRARRADLDVRAASGLPPRGLLGHLYWWAVAPFHGMVFGGMARNIAAAAEASQSPESPGALRD